MCFLYVIPCQPETWRRREDRQKVGEEGPGAWPSHNHSAGLGACPSNPNFNILKQTLKYKDASICSLFYKKQTNTWWVVDNNVRFSNTKLDDYILLIWNRVCWRDYFTWLISEKQNSLTKKKQFEAGRILLKVQVWKPVNNEIFAFLVPLEEEKSRWGPGASLCNTV